MGKGKYSKTDDIFKMLDNLSFEAVDSLDHVLHNQEVLMEAWKRVGEVVNDLVDKVANIEEAFKRMAKSFGCGGCSSGGSVDEKKDSPEIYV